MGRWPSSSEDNSLSPNYRVNINVSIASSGTVNGKQYDLVDQSVRASTTSSDSNVIWTGNTESHAFSLTNTARDAATARMLLQCKWQMAGSGGQPNPISGEASADLVLVDSIVAWAYDPRSKIKAALQTPRSSSRSGAPRSSMKTVMSWSAGRPRPTGSAPPT